MGIEDFQVDFFGRRADAVSHLETWDRLGASTPNPQACPLAAALVACSTWARIVLAFMVAVTVSAPDERLIL